MAKSPEINLSKISTRAPKGLDKDKIKNITKGFLDEIETLQNLMYAENKHSLLIIIQGMDASGKDGLTRDVFTSVNPQGIQVRSWKAPTAEELSHDFLWRIHQHTPAKGMIQIHNRSHYEDILITRVHQWIDDATAKKRMKSINNFENHLIENNNTTILKFYLHISHEEQLSRLQERMQIPEKMWKYNENDLKESELWDIYMNYYEDAFNQCNQPAWNIVPSDQNWYKNYVVAETILQTLKSFKMQFPGMKKS
ncbi:MAG: polyphosphate kinase [Bacteroidetes bacterium]|jgi:PPK2 family polyphosphate:nucleotide phosphotransferase|nr:polyphosphate kinase [Bacteroidota bacterium]HMT34830.1 polyphosphate kinase [Chitinophagaceae bacterium]MBK6821056.1 polyphosphate kinase [Bacteroidota bacterium]MBK7039344.1 polyphosphate kinase [Bacteroidota bacterium]MBK7588233.1 polyphosphate kinase [Bacteroidota bacterium]